MNAAGDPREIEKFASIAERWWDPEGPMAPLHRMSAVRLAYLKRVCSRALHRDEEALRPFEGLCALDIGCGGGLVSEPLARLGFSVTGIDPSSEVIGAARDHATDMELSIDYRVGLIADLPESQRGTFDLVTALEVVEHVPDVAGFVREAARLVKPGGILIASTLNRTAKSFALAIVGAEYVLRWLPIGTHSYRSFVRPDELSRAMAAAGLQEIDRTGFTYNPLRSAWSMSTDLDVNYIMTARA